MTRSELGSALVQDYNREERLTAQLSQRTLIIILPLVFSTFVTGSSSVSTLSSSSYPSSSPPS
jgi:hypothetical protein